MEKNTKDTMKYCSCQNCQIPGVYNSNYFWLRCFLVVIIIFMVFGLGLKVGEYQGFFESQRDNGFETYRHSRMPNFYYNQAVTPVAPPTTK